MAPWLRSPSYSGQAADKRWLNACESDYNALLYRGEIEVFQFVTVPLKIAKNPFRVLNQLNNNALRL